MFSANKHSYLHSRTTVNPRIINRCVDKAREFPTVDQFDETPGFYRLASEQPCIPVQNCDVTRRPLAFGNLAMPKLRRELHDKDPFVVIQAVNTLADLVHDPEHNAEAIKLRIPDRLQDLIENHHPSIRERALIILLIMSNLLDAKMQILNNKLLLKTILKAINDEDTFVQTKALLLLEKLGENIITSNLLTEGGFLEILMEKLENSPHDDENYDSLLLSNIGNLIHCEGKQIALEKGLFKALVKTLKVSPSLSIISQCLKNLGLLMESEEGKNLAIKYNLLKLLFEFLHHEDVQIYESAACALIFATVKTEAILKAIKLQGLCERLLFLIQHAPEMNTKKYCMQVLRNLSAHRDIRLGFLEEHFHEIEKVNVKYDEAAQEIKYKLLYDEIR